MREKPRPDAVFRMGRMEAWGRGIQRIFQTYREAENLEPQIELNGHEPLLQFTFEPSSFQALSANDAVAPAPQPAGRASVKASVKTTDALLDLLCQNPQMTLADVAAQVRRSVRAVEMASAKLVKAGRLRFVGPQKGGHWEVLP